MDETGVYLALLYLSPPSPGIRVGTIILTTDSAYLNVKARCLLLSTEAAFVNYWLTLDNAGPLSGCGCMKTTAYLGTASVWYTAVLNGLRVYDRPPSSVHSYSQ